MTGRSQKKLIFKNLNNQSLFESIRGSLATCLGKASESCKNDTGQDGARNGAPVTQKG